MPRATRSRMTSEWCRCGNSALGANRTRRDSGNDSAEMLQCRGRGELRRELFLGMFFACLPPVFGKEWIFLVCCLNCGVAVFLETKDFRAVFFIFAFGLVSYCVGRSG